MDEAQSRAAMLHARNPNFFRLAGSPEAHEAAVKASRARTAKLKAREEERAVALEAERAPAKEGWTAKARAAFLAEIAEHGNATRAARVLGLTLSGAYGLKARNAEFARAWGEARELYADAAEVRVTELALGGIEKEVVHKGEVRTIRHHSDKLLSTLLTRRRGTATGGATTAGAETAEGARQSAEGARLVIEARLAALEAKKRELGQ